MITIRDYRESDAGCVGRLIADTYGAFNLSFATPEERKRFLGPFQHVGLVEYFSLMLFGMLLKHFLVVQCLPVEFLQASNFFSKLSFPVLPFIPKLPVTVHLSL